MLGEISGWGWFWMYIFTDIVSFLLLVKYYPWEFAVDLYDDKTKKMLWETNEVTKVQQTVKGDSMEGFNVAVFLVMYPFYMLYLISKGVRYLVCRLFNKSMKHRKQLIAELKKLNEDIDKAKEEIGAYD